MRADVLNPEQQLAVAHGSREPRSGPLLIIAGAGAGKTATLAHRVARLIRDGADAERILLLTFSRRAAAELEQRAGRVLRATLPPTMTAPPSLPWAGTFHSIGARLLRMHAESLGLAANFTVHDRGDSEDLMSLLRHETLARHPVESRFPTAATCVAIYSRCVNAEAPLASVVERHFAWCAAHTERLRALFDDYVAAKQKQQVLDFDDLLLYWAAMLGEPALAAEVGSRFDHVLVDEYQDTNALQATVLKRLKPDGRGVTVVGDDAQAIYGFRAATVRNILDFPAQYAPPADVVTLARNYRSTEAVLGAANAVIALASERYTKDLVTDRLGGSPPAVVTVADEMAEARCVVERVLAWREEGIALKSQAVLFRSSTHSAHVELELARRNVPFVKYGGLKFLEAAHVKDALALLRWIENPRARLAGFRALRLLPGVGPATATRWLDALDAPAAQADPLAVMRAFRVPPAAVESWVKLVGVVASLRAPGSAWPGEFDAVVGWYAGELERLHEDAALRQADLEQLARIAATCASRERFLTELTLDPPSAAAGHAAEPWLDDDWLTLSTIHSAKGQEWKAVQILRCVDGCLPSDMANGPDEMEEERRLLYVAMTRARDELVMTLPQRFYVTGQAAGGDRHVYAVPSRFLPASVLRHCVRRTWPEPVRMAAEPTPVPRARIDVRALLRDVWKPPGAVDA